MEKGSLQQPGWISKKDADRLWSRPAIMQAEANLETGQVGEWKTIWEGTGGLVSSGF